MPRKNSQKKYIKNGYYHIYNRGVEKRIIFLDEQDYRVFLSYLKFYLTPNNRKELLTKLQNSKSNKEKEEIVKLLSHKNYHGKIELLAFVLMPNHFHFIVKQLEERVMNSFMSSVCNKYATYFNRRHKRTGHLYESAYKAVLIDTDEQLFELSRYIHRQGISIDMNSKWIGIQPSSFKEFLGIRKTSWIHPEIVVSFFSKTNKNLDYESFVLKRGNEECITKIIIEE